MSDTTQANTSSRSVKEFLFRQLEKLGVFSVVVLLLIWLTQNDMRRQAEQQKIDQQHWEQLFQQYREDGQAYRQTIEVCCHDRLLRLEAAETSRLRRDGRR